MEIDITFILGIEMLVTTLLWGIGIIVYRKKRAKKLKTKAKLLLPIIVLIVGLLLTGLIGYRWVLTWDTEEEVVDLVNHDNALNEYIEDHEEDFNITVEYGGEIDFPYDSSQITLSAQPDFDTFNLGNYEVSIPCTDIYGNTGVLEYNVTVEDTNMPVIENIEDSIHIDLGNAYLPQTLSVKAWDVVDGDLRVQFEGDVDTFTTGVYPVKAIAYDFNGNKTEEDFFAVVGNSGSTAEMSDVKLIQGETPLAFQPEDKIAEILEKGETSNPEEDAVEITDELIIQVLKGNYGNGNARKTNLIEAGYDPEEVQEALNDYLYNR